MRVFNLTDKPLDFHGQLLFPGQGKDFPELDSFIPTRDQELGAKKVVSFGSLPTWWKDKQRQQVGATKPPQIRLTDVPTVVEEAKVEEKVVSRKTQR